MSEVIDFEDDVLEEEEVYMGSVNHSLAQGKIIALLSSDERFSVNARVDFGC